MKLIEETAEALVNKKTWFPPEIESDPWVVYHGTSSVFEESIDRDGIQCGSTHLDEAALICATIIKTTEWYDDSATTSLTAYSIPRIAQEAPFFCGLFPPKSLIYTSREFAGGETARALRRIIPKLIDVAFENPDFFEKKFEEDRQKCINKAKIGSFTQDKVLKVNLNWLKEKNAVLRKFLPGLVDIHKKHRYGVVYALKLESEDVPLASYGSTGGLMIHKLMPARKCVAKLIVHGEHENGSDSNPDWEFQNFWREDCDLVKNLAKSGYRRNDQGSIDASQLFDPEGAEDLRFQIMIEHGNEMLRNFAIEQKEIYQRLLQTSTKNL
jgi:hypothetical protein